MGKDLLIHGENLEGLKYLIDSGFKNKIDLIYVDPPFATGGDFTVDNGRASTISRTKSGKVAYCDRITGDAFVRSVQERLILAKELLSDRGSIYLHTDYKIGHYLKVMMDQVFGIENFRNDITRIKCNPKNFRRIGYGNVKDMVLFYTKGTNPIWNEPKDPYTEEDLLRLFPKSDKDGRRYTTVPIHAPGETSTQKPFKGLLPPEGRHWRTDVETLNRWDEEGLIEWSANGNPRKIVYMDEDSGKRKQDIWTYKDPQYPVYPTEKNADLLDMIVRTSSSEDSYVLDFYCGSGTTLKAAAKNRRRWIGIDASPVAIEAVKRKLCLDEASVFQEEFQYIEL